MAATVELLGEIGFAWLTMAQVEARAGVGKASQYLCWPSKVEVVADSTPVAMGSRRPSPTPGAWLAICGPES